MESLNIVALMPEWLKQGEDTWVYNREHLLISVTGDNIKEYVKEIRSFMLDRYALDSLECQILYPHNNDNVPLAGDESENDILNIVACRLSQLKWQNLGISTKMLQHTVNDIEMAIRQNIDKAKFAASVLPPDDIYRGLIEYILKKIEQQR